MTTVIIEDQSNGQRVRLLASFATYADAYGFVQTDLLGPWMPSSVRREWPELTDTTTRGVFPLGGDHAVVIVEDAA